MLLIVKQDKFKSEKSKRYLNWLSQTTNLFSFTQEP